VFWGITVRRIFSSLFIVVLFGGLVYAAHVADLSRTMWTDPATKLMWTKQDNGNDVNRGQAAKYCSNLRLGGHSDWQLPTIEELAGVYDQTQNLSGWHIKGGIRLTSGWVWSRTTGKAAGEAWFFGFDSGTRSSRPRRFSYLDRALCVRRSGGKGRQDPLI
jgi:hypothetical protein